MRLERRLLDFVLGGLAGAGLLALFARPEVVRAEDSKVVTGAGDNGLVMATGSSSHGGALLFLLDTATRVLSVYEAEGGSKGTRGLTFVAARKVDRDVFVTGYNDRSEYSYSDLVKRFQQEENRNKSLEDSPTSPPSAPPNAGAGNSGGDGDKNR